MLRVSVVVPDGQILNLDVRVNEGTRIPVAQFDLFYDGKLLPESSSIDKHAVKQNDVLMVGPRQASQPTPATPTQVTTPQPPPQEAGSAGVLRNILSRVAQRAQVQPGQPVQQRRRCDTDAYSTQLLSPGTDPEVFRSYVMSNSELLNQLLHNDRELAEAVLSDDNEFLRALLEHRERLQAEKKKKEEDAIRRLNANPFDVEAQKIIEEKIRQENVTQNMEMALEYSPESFGRVFMLYIPCEVNGHSMQAFVDSGAQQTIMSVDCAKRCGLMRFIDTNFAGMAQGVGSAPILGRVHLAQVKIGNTFFPCTFTILDSKKGSLEFLLGLDMLKRHQCCIDLKNNKLDIGPESISFLSEGEILEKESLVDEEDKERMLEAQKRTLPGAVAVRELEEKEEKEEKESKEAQQQQQQQQQSQQASHPAEQSRFPEDLIKKIMELGFPRAAVLEALTVSDGNPDMAVAYLMG